MHCVCVCSRDLETFRQELQRKGGHHALSVGHFYEGNENIRNKTIKNKKFFKFFSAKKRSNDYGPN